MSQSPGKRPRKQGQGSFAFGSRTRAMGTTGWEAYTVGFTLVGCILACSALGWWLDSKFGTTYWLPVLFLVGVVAGFREMMLTVSRINRDQQKKQEERPGAEGEAFSQGSSPADVRAGSFVVPAPPQGTGSSENTASGQAPNAVPPLPDVEDLDSFVKRLLQETKDVQDPSPESEKPRDK